MSFVRGIFSLLFLAAPFSGVSGQTPAQSERKLVWEDQFDGPTLDYSKWEIEQNAFGGGNQELQIYTDRPENVRVRDGKLILEARKDNANVMGTTREYSSGRVRSKHRGDWKYGRIEISAKLPKGQGLWSALWMLPTDEKYGTWAASGEIDILELRGQTPDVAVTTIHYGPQWPNNKYSGGEYTLPKGDLSDGFHLFALEWKKGELRWYIDGKLAHTETEWSTPGGKFPAPFDQRFHLIMNLAVGGRFLGNPDATTSFPARMEIDFVRVYQ